jgi:hypothetical protein
VEQIPILSAPFWTFLNTILLDPRLSVDQVKAPIFSIFAPLVSKLQHAPCELDVEALWRVVSQVFENTTQLYSKSAKITLESCFELIKLVCVDHTSPHMHIKLLLGALTMLQHRITLMANVKRSTTLINDLLPYFAQAMRHYPASADCVSSFRKVLIHGLFPQEVTLELYRTCQQNVTSWTKALDQSNDRPRKQIQSETNEKKFRLDPSLTALSATFTQISQQGTRLLFFVSIF